MVISSIIGFVIIGICLLFLYFIYGVLIYHCVKRNEKILIVVNIVSPLIITLFVLAVILKHFGL